MMMANVSRKLTEAQEVYMKELLDVKLRCAVHCTCRRQTDRRDTFLDFTGEKGAPTEKAHPLFFIEDLKHGNHQPLMQAACVLIAMRLERPVDFSLRYVPNGKHRITE